MTKFDKNWRGNRSLTLKNEKKNEGYSSYGDLFFFFVNMEVCFNGCVSMIFFIE